MLTVRVFPVAGFVTALTTVKMEAMKRLIADLDVVSVFIFSLRVSIHFGVFVVRNRFCISCRDSPPFSDQFFCSPYHDANLLTVFSEESLCPGHTSHDLNG